MKRKSPKFRNILEIAIVIVLIVVLNIIANTKFARIDLTEDKLHTLSDNTIEFLETEIDQVINIEIYLDGDLPAFTQKLKNSIREKIEEFQAYAGKKVKYRFINPNADKELSKALKEQLSNSGLYPSFIYSQEDGEEKSSEIWPGARILYGDREEIIQFLPGGQYATTPALIQGAVNKLEYDFVTAFCQLTNKERNTIGFLRGHDELNNAQAWVIHYDLRQFYNVDTVRIMDSTGKENLKALNAFDAVIIAKPRIPFTEKEKYIIDQYVMKGGKVIWLIDQLGVPEDSLSLKDMVNTYQVDLNIDDMLFKYGARINKNLVADINSAPIRRVDNGSVMPNWYLHPILHNQNNTILTKNVAPIKIRYGNSIEAVGSDDIKKTILLESSRNYKILPARFRVAYDYNQHGYRPIDSLRTDPDLTKPMGLLLEGEFTSHFKGRIIDKYINDPKANYVEQSKPNKMVVIADGDLIRNELTRNKNGDLQPYGLQYDPVIMDQNNQVVPVYGNGIFFHNLMDKLMGDEHLITLRSRMKIARLLNREEVSLNRKAWQVYNLTFPVILVVFLGLMQWYIRKRKFAVK